MQTHLARARRCFTGVSRFALCAATMALAGGVSLDPALARVAHKRPATVAPADQPQWKAKPEGPVMIVVSIAEQRLTLYDNGVPVARTVISTGVPGHLTPRGIFSIIQKDRYHKSNIYSDAPMPFMQRITWSGVALHEGHVTGHPASHGCIRLPAAFAQRLWPYTQMGMRVVVANEELHPEEISHPHLLAAAKRPSTAALTPRARYAQAAIGAQSDATVAPATAETAGDARQEQAVHPGFVVDFTAADTALTKLAGAVAAPSSDPVTAQIPAPAPAATPVIAAEAPAAEPAPVEARTAAAEVSSPVVIVSIPTPAPKPSASPAPVEPKHDVAALPPVDSAPVVAPPASGTPVAPAISIPPGSGHVAMFVSKKTGMLYVRRDFKPIFETPVVIRDPATPLGSHVFTVMSVSADGSDVHWSAVDMHDAPPPPAPRRLRKGETPPPPVVEAEPSTSAEALDRIVIPDDVRLALADLITPGASLVISDKGLGPETTAKGTDFIVLTR